MPELVDGQQPSAGKVAGHRDRVTVRAEIVAFDKERGRITMSTQVTNQRGEVVIDGEAKLVMAAALRKRG